jgi:hypothetical protein
MLAARLLPHFYVKHFQRFHKRASWRAKPPLFRTKLAKTRSRHRANFSRQRLRQPFLKKRTGWFRKWLWLIPFMLAKKLLSLGDGQPVKVFVTARGTKAHTRRNAA